MKVEEFQKMFRRATGWRDFVNLFFRDYSWARRLLGGKWELWVHDPGTHHAVLSWHWMNEWSDTKFGKNDHIVMKAWYENGVRLNHITAHLRENPIRSISL